MKIVTILVIAVFIPTISTCQVFNQDGDGKSSIIGFGGTLNLDVAESLVKANYYKSTRRTKGLAIGIDIQGKNSEGMVGFFENGSFSPEGEASVMVGGVNAFQRQPRTYRLLYYARVGVKTSEFKYDKGDTFTSVQNRFVDTVHTRPKIEVGASFRWGGRLLLGVLLGSAYENNYEALRKSTYKHVTDDATIPGLQRTQDITAYSGKYEKFSNTYFHFDAVYLATAGDTTYVAPAIYFRYNAPQRENIARKNAVVGLSLNFINVRSGKFFGGVYLQNNDLFDERLLSFAKSIEFGLVARFSLTTISPL